MSLSPGPCASSQSSSLGTLTPGYDLSVAACGERVTPRPFSMVRRRSGRSPWSPGPQTQLPLARPKSESLFLGTILTYRKEHVVWTTSDTQVCCITVCVCFCILACLVHFLKEDRADSALCFLLGGHGNNTACGVQGDSPDASCLGTWLWKLPSLQRLPQPAPTYLPRS